LLARSAMSRLFNTHLSLLRERRLCFCGQAPKLTRSWCYDVSTESRMS
jgi:hypothetical protein